MQADLIEAPEERNRAVAAVGERPAAHRPCDADDADHRKRHDHRVHDVLAAAQTPVEERQPGVISKTSIAQTSMKPVDPASNIRIYLLIVVLLVENIFDDPTL